MPVQVARLREPEQAKLALVRFFPRVYSQVFCERRRVTEGLLAQSTPVRSLARVGAHVRGNGRRLRKSPIANLTPERFFAGVRANMCRQVGRLAERLVAVVAPVRFFTRMGAEMGLQRTGPRVRLTAYPTQVWPAPVFAADSHRRRSDGRTLQTHPVAVNVAADIARRH